MLALDNGDKIRGDTTTAEKVDYTIHGVVGTTVKQLADGQLPDSTGDLYTSSADETIIASITLVNTNTSAESVNLYLLPSGGTARRLITKDMSLGVGYMLLFNGNKLSVYDENGYLHKSVTTTTEAFTVSELRLTPKESSTGPEGTIFYDSVDKCIYVGVE